MEHARIPFGEIHTPYQWLVADEAERGALVPKVGDENKLCLQASDRTEWRLVSVSPAVWEPTSTWSGVFGKPAVFAPAPHTHSATMQAGEPVGGHRIVVAGPDGRAYYANNATASHANRVIGLTTGAAAALTDAEIVRTGEVEEPSWSWDTDLPLYLGTNGLMTQLAPSVPASFSMIVGFPITPTKVFIAVREPIFLGD